MPPLNPPPVITANLMLLTQPLTLAGSSHTSEVTFALDCGAEDLATAQDAVDDFQANFNSHIAPLIFDGATIQPPFAKLGQGTTTPLEVVAAGVPIIGSSTGDILPPNTSVLVKKTTSLGGKQNRGRSYYPYMAQEAHVDDTGLIATATVVALQSAFSAFLAQLGTDGTPMVIANRLYNVPLAPHYVTRVNIGPAVTAYTVEGTIATQRRRLRG